MTATAPPPAGWYDDPADDRRSRYWDGERWTDGVSVRGVVTEEPLPPEGAEAAWDARTDHRARWPGRVAVIAVVGSILSDGAALGLVLFGRALDVDGAFAEIALGMTGLYGGLLLTCVATERVYGNGDLRRDFALEYRRGDWWRGLVGSLAARGAAMVLAVVLLLWSHDLLGSNTEAFTRLRSDVAVMALLVVVVLVTAPVVEELFFRGLMMRSLETFLPVWAAIGLQAVLFGLAHYSVHLGPGNVSVMASTAAGGVVFGIVAHRYHRLGPSIAAHAWFNLVPVAVILLGATDV